MIPPPPPQQQQAPPTIEFPYVSIDLEGIDDPAGLRVAETESEGVKDSVNALNQLMRVLFLGSF